MHEFFASVTRAVGHLGGWRDDPESVRNMHLLFSLLSPEDRARFRYAFEEVSFELKRGARREEEASRG